MVCRSRSKECLPVLRIAHVVGVLAVLIIPGSLLGQRAATSSSINGKLLPLQTDTFAIFLIRGSDTVETGRVIDEITSNGKTLVRVYDTDDRVLGPQLDTIVSQLDDLRPIAYYSRSNAMVAHLNFEDRRVTGWTRLANGDSVAVRMALPSVAYDGTSYDLVIRASHLRDGFELTVPAFLVESNTVGSITGRVVGSASVDSHDCWVFSAHFGRMPVTFWIDKSTRALRRQLMQVRVDMGILFTAPHPKKSDSHAS